LIDEKENADILRRAYCSNLCGLVAEHDALAAIYQPLLESAGDPIALATAAAGLLELCDLCSDLFRDAWTVGIVLSVESDVCTIHLLDGARKDQRLTCAIFVWEMLAEAAAKRNGASITCSGWYDELTI
jgi:hypothetical protein